MPRDIYEAKLKELFGGLIDNYWDDQALLEHRVKHGGVDIL